MTNPLPTRAGGQAWSAARLGGRCANGAERDRGSLIHAVPVQSATAICGATYGCRSAGWFSEPDAPITCPKCLHKLPEPPQ